MPPHRRQPTRLPCPWDSPGKNTGVGCHFLLWGIIWIQKLNPGLLQKDLFIYLLLPWDGSYNYRNQRFLMRVWNDFCSSWRRLQKLTVSKETKRMSFFTIRGLGWWRKGALFKELWGAVIIEPLWTVHSSAPPLKTGGLLARVVWYGTREQLRRFGLQSYIKGLDKF